MSRTLRIDTPRWALPLHDTKARYKGAHGGRGSGKSHERAEALIERCIIAPTNAVCLREVQKSLNQSVKKLLEIKIEALGVGHLFEVQRDRIMGVNGSLIQFQGLQQHTADSIKSLEGIDIAWIEEAQSISQRSLDILRPTIRKPDSEIWATWNPNLPTDPIEFLRNDPPTSCVVVEVNYMDNPWLPDILLTELEYDRKRDIDKFNHIWLGQYLQNSEARVFKNWRVEEFESPSDTLFKQGADWGFAIDPTVLIRCYTSGKKLYIDYEAHQHHCDIVDIPSLFSTVPDSELYPIVGDSSRPETISHLRQNGYPRIFPSSKGKGSVEDGIEWLKSFDIIVHPRCTYTIDELTNYCYKIDEMTGQVTGKLKDDNNHVIDALRYACEAARKKDKVTQVHVTPIPIRNRW